DVTRARSLSPSGSNSTAFQMRAGTVTLPSASVSAGPLSPTPPLPYDPMTMYASYPWRTCSRIWFSRFAQGPPLFAGACGIMLVIKKVAAVAAYELVRSADGQLCPLSNPDAV